MRFTLLSVFLASCAIAVVWSMCNVFSLIYGYDFSIGTLSVSTFVSGMVLVATGAILSQSNSNAGRKLVQMGGIMMASLPIGFLVVLTLSAVLQLIGF